MTGTPRDAALRDHLARNEDRWVTLLGRLVDMDSPSGDVERVGAVLEVVEAEVRRAGAATSRVAADGAADHLVARWPGAGAKVLVLAHADTVWPVGEAARRPFSADGDRYGGPGVFDMKAGLVQALAAIDALRSTPDGLTADVTLVVSSDEESGSVTSRSAIEELAKSSDVVLVVEPATGPKLKTARKGVGMYRVDVEGRAAHAGLDPENGRSAVLELAHQVVALHALADPSVGTTVCVGMIDGGSARNVVPARASATVDLRVVTREEAERLDAAIHALAPVTPGTTVRVTGGINRPPMERLPSTAALYERAAASASRLGIELGEVLVGGGSDGNFTAALGVPTLDGLGAVGGGAHALDEHVLKASIVERSLLLAALIDDYGARGVPQA